MKNKNRVMMILFIGALLLAILAFSGCGHDGMGSGTEDYYSMLEPDVHALYSRLQSHYDTVAGVVNFVNQGGNESERIGMGTPSDGPLNVLSAEDWETVQQEREDYDQDMHRTLKDLGETVATIGACRMMMGGMTFGPEDTGIECPCGPYMETSTEELEIHLSEMISWMDQEDMSGLWEEMEDHWEQMGSHIQVMASHMRQIFGSGGGMMGMM